MEDDIDMTGVEPVRRAETLRRVRAVKRYLALPRASGEVARQLAEELGLKQNQFLVLVRAWAVHGRASALPGAQRRYTFLFEEERSRVAPRVEAIMEESIEEVGPDKPMATILRHAASICEQEGLQPPALTALRPRVDGKRRALLEAGGDRDVVLIGRCNVDVPVLGSDGTVQPAVVALAVSARYGHVLAFDAGTVSKSGSIPKTIVQLARDASTDGSETKLRVTLPRGDERRQIAGAFSMARRLERIAWVGRGDPASTVQGLLGGRLGNVAIRAPLRRSEWRTGPKLQARLANAVEPGDLVSSIADLVGHHNQEGVRARKTADPISFGSELSMLVLLRALADTPT